MNQIRIAIVGAGIAGLTSAIALYQKGFTNIIIYEKDTSFTDRRQGYGLTLMQGLSALRRLGLAERVRQELDAPALAHYTFHGPTGNLLGLFGTILWTDDLIRPLSPTSANKRNLHVSRQALRGFLLSEFNKFTNENIYLKWNSRIMSIKSFCEDSSSIVLKFSDGSMTEADIIIAADGINSIIRSTRYPSTTCSPLE